MRDLVDDIILLDDNGIVKPWKCAMRYRKWLWRAMGLAAAVWRVQGKLRLAWSSKVWIIVSGGNVDIGVLWESPHKQRWLEWTGKIDTCSWILKVQATTLCVTTFSIHGWVFSVVQNMMLITHFFKWSTFRAWVSSTLQAYSSFPPSNFLWIPVKPVCQCLINNFTASNGIWLYSLA
jgi:hypothetical protein